MRIAFLCNAKYVLSLKKIMNQYHNIETFYFCSSDKEQKIKEDEYKIKIDKNYEYEIFKLLEIDLVLMYSWKYLIPENVLNRIPVYNFHPSLLPAYRGPLPLTFQILNGEKTGGVTLHKVDKYYDNGAIYTQMKYNISSNDTSVILEIKVFQCIKRIMDMFVKDLINSNILLTNQDISKVTCYSYADLNKYIIDNTYSLNKFLQISRYINKVKLKIKVGNDIYFLKNYKIDRDNICNYEYCLTNKKIYVSIIPYKDVGVKTINKVASIPIVP